MLFAHENCQQFCCCCWENSRNILQVAIYSNMQFIATLEFLQLFHLFGFCQNGILAICLHEIFIFFSRNFFREILFRFSHAWFCLVFFKYAFPPWNLLSLTPHPTHPHFQYNTFVYLSRIIYIWTIFARLTSTVVVLFSFPPGVSFFIMLGITHLLRRPYILILLKYLLSLPRGMT